jgi:hypothetical protein
VSDTIPTLREYGKYLESLERPLDIDELVVDARADGNGGAPSRARTDDWDRDLEVLTPIGVEERVVSIEPTRRERSVRSRKLIAVAAVAAAIVLIAAALLLRGTRGKPVNVEPAGPGPAPTTPKPPLGYDAPPQTYPGDGSTDGPLLPEGAPSTPHTGELVAAVSSLDGAGIYYLYADGRLLKADMGWLTEQRLTPAGVERVRSKFLSSKVFDRARSTRDVEQCVYTACVRDGGRYLVAPESAPATLPGSPPPTLPEFAPDVARLVLYMMDLDSSLPKAEWADAQPNSYVASRIMVCVQAFEDRADAVVPVPHDLSVFLSEFPRRAAALFEGRERLGPDAGPNGICFEMTRDEARTLERELLGPSGRGSHEYYGIVVRNPRYGVLQPDAADGVVAFINFQTLLPNGSKGF